MSGRMEGFLVDPITGQVRPGEVAWDGGELTGGQEREGEAPAGAFLILPGRVCGHAELSLSLLPGMPRRAGEGEVAWRERYLGALDGPALKAAVRLGALQTVLAGFTLVCDLHRSRVEGALEITAEALQEIGLRGVLALDVSDGNRERMAAAARFHRSVGEGESVRGMMGLAEPGRLAAPDLASAVTLARQAEMAFHILLPEEAESRRSLYEKGALRPGSIAIGTALPVEERALLRDLHAWQGAAPPFQELARGGDFAAELFDRPFGRFAPGAPADLVAFAPELAAPVSPATLESHLDALSPRNLREMVIGGARVMEGRRLRTVDEEEIRSTAQEALRKVWLRAA